MKLEQCGGKICEPKRRSRKLAGWLTRKTGPAPLLESSSSTQMQKD